MTIPELTEKVEERLRAYKSVLEWAIRADRPQIDKDAIDSMIGAYQDVLNIIKDLQDDESENMVDDGGALGRALVENTK